jgi:hypothetical protein
MKSSLKLNRVAWLLLAAASVFLILPPDAAAKKEKITIEKKYLLDWLAQPQVVERFGRISDAIWSYAELGMQEFNSSKLLADTLEAEGFTLERGAAGLPTCFVASYGSGRPVIGLLEPFYLEPDIK